MWINKPDNQYPVAGFRDNHQMLLWGPLWGNRKCFIAYSIGSRSLLPAQDLM